MKSFVSLGDSLTRPMGRCMMARHGDECSRDKGTWPVSLRTTANDNAYAATNGYKYIAATSVRIAP